MKKIIPAIILFLAFSCSDFSNDPDTGLIGTWRLTETLFDPGDGSGKFQKVDSKKEITFLKNGEISVNGGICSMLVETGETESGTYSLTEGTLTAPNCPSEPRKVRFSHSGTTLIIDYPCIEPCSAKFRKLK